MLSVFQPIFLKQQFKKLHLVAKKLLNIFNQEETFQHKEMQ